MTSEVRRVLIAWVVCCIAISVDAQGKRQTFDVSQTVTGTVAIRDNDGSVRPAQLIEVYFYEPRSKDVDPLAAWERLKRERLDDFRKHEPKTTITDACGEAMGSVMAGLWADSATIAANDKGKVDEIDRVGLDLYTHTTTDEKGHFKETLAVAGNANLPNFELYGKLLIVAFLHTETTIYAWEKEIEVRKGEETQTVLSEPNVCRSD